MPVLCHKPLTVKDVEHYSNLYYNSTDSIHLLHHLHVLYTHTSHSTLF